MAKGLFNLPDHLVRAHITPRLTGGNQSALLRATKRAQEYGINKQLIRNDAALITHELRDLIGLSAWCGSVGPCAPRMIRYFFGTMPPRANGGTARDYYTLKRVTINGKSFHRVQGRRVLVDMTTKPRQRTPSHRKMTGFFSLVGSDGRRHRMGNVRFEKMGGHDSAEVSPFPMPGETYYVQQVKRANFDVFKKVAVDSLSGWVSRKHIRVRTALPTRKSIRQLSVRSRT